MAIHSQTLGANNMSISVDQRVKLIDKLVEKWADDIDMDSLLDYFIDGQGSYLESVSDEQLLEYAEENDIELEELTF